MSLPLDSEKDRQMTSKARITHEAESILINTPQYLLIVFSRYYAPLTSIIIIEVSAMRARAIDKIILRTHIIDKTSMLT